MVRVLVTVLTLALVLLQGLGVLVVHDHPIGVGDGGSHVHRYVPHGDDHHGHASDAAPAERPHLDTLEAAGQQVREVLVAGLVAVVLLLVAAQVRSSGVEAPGGARPRGRPPRLLLRRLAIQQV